MLRKVLKQHHGRRGLINSEPLTEPVKLDTRAQVLLIMLDRPARAQAVDRFMAEQLYVAFRAFESSDKYKAAVLCSTSDHFCSGYDVFDVKNPSYGQLLTEQLVNLPANQSPMGPCKMDFTKPVIAAIEGAAVAGGFELALCADLRVASKSAYFGFYNRKLNVPLIDGGALLLNNLIGKGRAMDMIMTGRRVDAEEAFQLGIVNRLVEGSSLKLEDGSALDTAIELARQICALPQQSLIHDKLMLNKVVNEKLNRAELMSPENTAAAIDIVQQTLKTKK